MNRKQIVPLVIAMIALALLQTACLRATPGPDGSGPRPGNSSRSTNNSRSKFTAKSEVRTFELDVKPDMTQMTLDLDIKLDSGTIALILTDPQEEVRLEKEFTGSTHLDEVFHYEPIAGTWTLEMTLEDATGSYHVKWKARN
jgi:hypothetical protein